MTSDPGAGAAPAPEPKNPRSRWSGIARQVLPWLIAAGCLVYSFEVVPLDESLAALRRARLATFFPLAG